MRITRIAARNLRGLHSLDLELADGVTVVTGPNESGKSTILAAVELGLFGLEAADGGAASIRSRIAGHGGEGRAAPHEPSADPFVRLELLDEESGRRIRIERTLGADTQPVQVEQDSQPLLDREQVVGTITAATGIPTTAFLRSSIEARQGELRAIERAGVLRERLVAPITAGDRRSRAVQVQLEQILHDLEDRENGRPGRLAVAEEAFAQIDASVENGDAALARLVEDRMELIRTGDRLAVARAALAEMRRMIEESRRAEEVTEALTSARGRRERYERAIAISSELTHLESSHPSPTPLPVLRAATARIRELQARIAVISEGKLGPAVDLTLDEPDEPRGRFGAISAAFGGRARAQELREEQVARRLRGRSNLEQELGERQVSLAGELASVGQIDPHVAFDLLVAEEAHVASIDRLTAELESLVGRQPVETLPALRDAAGAEAEQRLAELQQLEPEAREAGARAHFEAEAQAAEFEVEAAFAAEAAARGRVDAALIDSEQVAVEAERRAEWRRQLERLRVRARTARVGLDALRAAETATGRTAARFVERDAGGYLARLTGGRYEAVRIEDSSLAITVREAREGAWVAPEALTPTTADLLGLAVRIGIARNLAADRRPPLLLDEPFGALDDKRAAAAFALLRDLAGELQVVVLTASHRFDALADRVIELGAGGAVTARHVVTHAGTRSAAGAAAPSLPRAPGEP